MRVVVKKWGNSAAVRIPRGVMDAARLVVDQPVDIIEQDGQVLITPVLPQTLDLAQLLQGITPENLPGSVDFGAPVGRELL